MDDGTRRPLMRRLLMRASRRVVLRQKWPREFGGGLVYVSPDIGLRYWFTSLSKAEPELFRVAELLCGPGDRVFDLGANMGIFSLASAHLVGESGSVVSVEADTWLVDLLRRSFGPRQEGKRIRVLPAAITSKVGVVEFNIARDGRASNFIGEFSAIAGGVREKQNVVSISLDWLAQEAGAPDVVKIDVEGMELEALRGAGRVLSECRPRMYVEVGGERQAEVTGILAPLNYRFFAFEDGALRELPGVGWNTVILPTEQTERFAKHIKA
jgi:FkbM family methyltransferase